jgi:hypothetical protein
MINLDSAPVNRVLRFVRRYQPFIAVVLAVLLLVAFLPGDDDDDGGGETLAVGDTATNTDGQSGGQGLPAAAGAPSDTTVPSPPPVAGRAARAPRAAGAPAVTAPAGPAVTAPPVKPGTPGKNCDTKTGRVKLPTTYAAPCVAPFSGNNGGRTAQGVEPTKIKVVFYSSRTNPAVDAALTAAGANNTYDQQVATFKDYVAIFNSIYELYGRQVEVIVKQGSGQADDDAAGKADGIDVATNIKPFAVVANAAAGPSPAFMRELAARKILCVCGTSLPQEFYEQNKPYVGYTTLMASNQGYIHRAEYIGKRLAGKPAVHAGDVLMTTQPRVFGLLYFETADRAYKSGVDFFERELTKYNVRLKARLAYTGLPNVAATQEQARPLIQRLKEDGVTSVVFSGDPVAPAIFTQEATRQQYSPEWIITGSALTDTTIFARTYDQTQWSHAFGVSYLAARFPDEEDDDYRLHTWFHGRPPTADNQYGVIYTPTLNFFTGLHLAGPKLTVETWQRGLFSYPITGRGRVTDQSRSWGSHGIWPFTDYTAFDDVTEIWWDPQALGEDEVGNRGIGMYRYVDGGKRYMPGTHPRGSPRVFDPNGSPTYYEHRPAAERPPDYPPPRR